jgi:hypothetical protein
MMVDRPLPNPLLPGEGLKILIFSLFLPFCVGEGGWEGEVCQIDGNKYVARICGYYTIDYGYRS